MLNNLLNPSSIAVIGASSNKKKLGWQILNNVIQGGYQGNIYPVNLKERTIEGKKAYKSILDIEGPVDVAVIVIPAPAVSKVLEECGEKGIKNAIIISAGFSEADKEGDKREGEIEKIAQKHDIHILGPNCLGLINKNQKLNATFAHTDIENIASGKEQGKIAFISQSGAIGSSILDWSQSKNFGLSYFVSLGNKAGVGENELLEYFLEDKNAEVIALYLEEITQGKKFMEAASKLAKKKPVIVLKAGMTSAGNQASLSHTGSIGGSREAVLAGLKRSGAMIAGSLEEFLELLELWGKKKDAVSGDIHLVSNAGGPAVVAMDEVSQAGLRAGKLTSSTKQELSRELPSVVLPANPLDIIGDADAARYKKSLEILLSDEQVKNILVLLTPQTSTETEETARQLVRLNKKYKDKLILASFIGGTSLQDAKRILEEGNVVHYDYPTQAINVLKKLKDFRQQQKVFTPYRATSTDETSKKKGRQWDYLDSFKVLEEFDISTIETVAVSREKDLEDLTYPVALKATGPGVIHKTDEGLLRLGLSHKKEAKQALREMKDKLGEGGYCVAQPMLGEGMEMLVGFDRDPRFGPIIMIGAGGIYTEILRDVATEVEDVNLSRAKRMIERLKIYKLLRGARGGSGYDISGLAETVVKLAKLARKYPGVKELDINPLFVSAEEVKAGDVRIIE